MEEIQFPVMVKYVLYTFFFGLRKVQNAMQFHDHVCLVTNKVI